MTAAAEPATQHADELRGLPAASIADLLGDIDAVVVPLLARRTELRAEVGRRRLVRLAGDRWRIERSVTSPLVADVPAIQARMGEAWMKAFRKRQIRVEFTILPCRPAPEANP